MSVKSKVQTAAMQTATLGAIGIFGSAMCLIFAIALGGIVNIIGDEDDNKSSTLKEVRDFGRDAAGFATVSLLVAVSCDWLARSKWLRERQATSIEPTEVNTYGFFQTSLSRDDFRQQLFLYCSSGSRLVGDVLPINQDDIPVLLDYFEVQDAAALAQENFCNSAPTIQEAYQQMYAEAELQGEIAELRRLNIEAQQAKLPPIYVLSQCAGCKSYQGVYTQSNFFLVCDCHPLGYGDEACPDRI